MLVIRRHPGESIRVGEEVEIVVMECGQGRVKLGIRAPQEIPVVRGEVELTRRQNLAAAHALEAAVFDASRIDGTADTVAWRIQSFPIADDKQS